MAQCVAALPGLASFLPATAKCRFTLIGVTVIVTKH
jgi:hypothetical protein